MSDRMSGERIIHLAEVRLSKELRRLLIRSGISIRAKCGVVKPVIDQPTLADGRLCANCQRARGGGVR